MARSNGNIRIAGAEFHLLRVKIQYFRRDLAE